MKPPSVCIVGKRAQAPPKNKNGSFIDSCDIVIRMGNYTTDGYEEYIGSKTDVYISTVEEN